MFQKKLMPKSFSAICSKWFFYPTFPITLLNRWGNLWTQLDDTAILGVAPMTLFGHPQQLYDQGVRGVVNMCYEYEGPVKEFKRLGIEQLHLPSFDHYEPELVDLERAVQFIAKYKKKGQKVYVHCKAGHGRGASVALCWLMNQAPHLSSKV